MNLMDKRQGDVPIVEVSGRIDAANAEAFSEALRKAVGDADRAAVLDLAGLSHMGSTGLRSMLLIARELENRDARLLLCALSSRIRRVFTVTGFDRFLAIHATRADALAALEEGQGGAQAP